MAEVKLSCGTLVPAWLLDELAHAALSPYIPVPHAPLKSAAKTYIRTLDKEGKLLGELKEVLGWEPAE